VDPNPQQTLYVVHCVDTEGPLHESLDATFDRIRSAFGRDLPATPETLAALRRGEIDLGGREDLARVMLSEHLLAYNDTWDQVDAMLDEMMRPPFRERYADPQGDPWTFSWFCVDHVGYASNPRRRDMGYHNIFDHYRAMLKRFDVPDEIHWHVHPMSTYGEAHRNATAYLRTPHVLEGLARRAIDRGWFPACFRPGFHAERPDSHWLLEQYVPFDYGNQAMPRDAMLEGQDDLANGRFGDWRRAPDDWAAYHPDHDDYQSVGSCRRTIFRCLNVGTRLRLLDEHEVRRAFERAASGRPTTLAFTNHDFRDMRRDVAETHALIDHVADAFPQVRWRTAGALRAARAIVAQGEVLGGPSSPPGGGPEAPAEPEPLALQTRARRAGGALHLEVEANHPIFGPQPLLAVKTHSQQYLVDNLDIQEPFRRWSYVFDEQSFRPASLEVIALAAADASGSTAVTRLDGSGAALDAEALAALER